MVNQNVASGNLYRMFMTLSNVFNNSIIVINNSHIKICFSIKPHALVVNSMLESKNMDTLVFTPKYFYCF